VATSRPTPCTAQFDHSASLATTLRRAYQHAGYPPERNYGYLLLATSLFLHMRNPSNHKAVINSAIR
jgi:hypothetical protein